MSTSPILGQALAQATLPPQATLDETGNTPTQMIPAQGQLVPPLSQENPPAQSAPMLPPRPPGTGVASQPPPSKAEYFRNLLGHFFNSANETISNGGQPPTTGDKIRSAVGDYLYSVGKGLAARGSGPDADLRGAGAAITAIPERNIQQRQLAIANAREQALANLQGAQTGALQAKSGMVNVPLIGRDGKPTGSTVPMTQADADAYLTKMGVAGTAAQSRTDVQTSKGETAKEVAGINAASREQVAANKPVNDTEISLIKKANAGDKDAAAALRTLQANRMAVAGERAKMAASSRGIEVLDYDKDGQPTTRFVTMGDAIKGGFSGASQGARNTSKTAQIQDIQYSSGKLRQAIQAAEPFTPAQIAKLQVALTSTDEKAISTQFGALANDLLSPAQQDVVIWLKNINERALSLRNIAGQGQGAQDTRAAIRSLLPGLTSGNKQMMFKQLDAFDNQTSILAKGIPRPGGANRPTGGAAKNYSPDNPFAKQ